MVLQNQSYHDPPVASSPSFPSFLTTLLCVQPCLSKDTRLITLALTQHVRVLLKRAADELVVGPQVGREEAVGAGDSDEGGFERILKRLGGAGGGGVDVVDTCELQQTLDGGRGDEAGTTWSGDQLYFISLPAKWG